MEPRTWGLFWEALRTFVEPRSLLINLFRAPCKGSDFWLLLIAILEAPWDSVVLRAAALGSVRGDLLGRPAFAGPPGGPAGARAVQGTGLACPANSWEFRLLADLLGGSIGSGDLRRNSGTLRDQWLVCELRSHRISCAGVRRGPSQEVRDVAGSVARL